MNLLTTYTKQEALMIVAEHAGKNLPSNKEGTIIARFLDDGSVEIMFLDKKESNQPS